MKSNKLFFTTFLITASLNLFCIVAKAQDCKDEYNNVLGLYQKGQFENINNSLAGCIADINSNMANYLQSASGRTTVFKVYKLIINSYKNLDQENSANEKLNDLVRLTHMPQGDVQNELNNTPLTMIE